MAEEKAQAATKETKPEKKGGMFSFILIMVSFGAAVPFIIPTLFLLVGMLPTLVALITETDRRGSSIKAVGAMNAAGLTPFIIDLWHHGQTIGHATEILATPQTWLIMFGAAAVGKLILFAVPQAVASGSIARAESRMKILKVNLELLKKTWGSDVATTKPLERILRGD